jgi:hypothetical protein
VEHLGLSAIAAGLRNLAPSEPLQFGTLAEAMLEPETPMPTSLVRYATSQPNEVFVMNSRNQHSLDAAAPGGKETLEQQLNNVIAFFNERRSRLLLLDVRFFIAQAVFTILTTVLVGLQLTSHETTLRNLALISSALAGLLTLVLGHFRFRERYIAYTTASSKLNALLSKLQFLQSLDPVQREEVLSQEALIKMHSEFQAVLDQVDERWNQIVSAALVTTAPAGSSETSGKT